MIVSKCHGCEERHINCHSSCESYQAFRADRDRVYNERQLQVDSKYVSNMRRTRDRKRTVGYYRYGRWAK